MHNHLSFSRRQLIQRVTALTLGATFLPRFNFANAPVNDPDKSRTIYIAPGEGVKAKVGEMDITFKLGRNQTDGHMGMWETVIQPGELGAPPHLHNTFDELCHVKEGSVFIRVGDEVTEVQAGGWHLRPKGVVHTFWNSSKVAAKTIDICLPGGHESYMQELAALFENGKRPKPDDFKILEQKHDIVYRFDLLKGIMQQYKVKL